jgi:hypothetical protein
MTTNTTPEMAPDGFGSNMHGIVDAAACDAGNAIDPVAIESTSPLARSGNVTVTLEEVGGWEEVGRPVWRLWRPRCAPRYGQGLQYEVYRSRQLEADTG